VSLEASTGDFAMEADSEGAGRSQDRVIAAHSAFESATRHERGFGYGVRRQPNLAGIGVTVAVHLALLAGLLHLGAQYVEHRTERFVAVDLRAAPPPPALPEAAPPPSRDDIVIEKPAIELSRPTPVVVAIQPAPVQRPSIAVPQPAATQAAPPSVNPAPAPAPSIVDASDLGTRMISGDPPRYPRESRRKREQGTVMLSVTLDTGGRVAEISVAQSSGYRRLDHAALEAVRRWRWAPAQRDGIAVMMRGVVPIPFILQEKA